MDTKIAEIAALGLLMMFYILGGPEERAHTAGASLQANPTPLFAPKPPGPEQGSGAHPVKGGKAGKLREVKQI